MASRLADHLSAARLRTFVGRENERNYFQQLITSHELPFYVLQIFGPGGVGKTTLLKEFVSMCNQTLIAAFYVDGRNFEATPGGFLAALNMAMQLDPAASGLEALSAASSQHRQVILIDTYEILTPIDGWLREVFLPQLPENVLVVIAGQRPLSSEWRTDSGWQCLFRTIPLRNLTPQESLAYLEKRNVPAEQHQRVLDFTHGHPLALCLVADVFAQRPGINFQPETAPDVVKTLLEQLVQKVPGPAHRTALEACALLRLTTEPQLAAMMQTSDAHELFEWLRGLSFIEAGSQGLFPHDLAREALNADLRWRNPDWYAELHRRARNFYAARLQSSRGLEQQKVLFDYIFLHRDNPVVRPFLEWQESSNLMTDQLRSADVPVIVGLVEKYEGRTSARLAEYWIKRQPQGVRVLRDSKQQVEGFMIMVGLHLLEEEDLKVDPAVAAAWNYLQRQAPLRPGEIGTYFRFWMDRDTYQSVSATQSLIFINAVQHYLTTPGLAYTFFSCQEPDFWQPVLEYAALTRLEEAGFEAGGRCYGAFGHDWRAMPPLAWLALLADREIAGQSQEAVATPQPSTPLVVLSQPEFFEAVDDALRDFARPGGLSQNPLLRSRLVVEQVKESGAPADRVTTLQALLKKACEALQASPKEAKYYRALYHTYLHPAATQEQAAELVDVPFSSFRRHLKAGVTRVEEILWQKELQGLVV